MASSAAFLPTVPDLKVRFQADPPVGRDVLARWQADLETVVPRSDRVPWLRIVFQPGLSYEPVGRFELYEMTAQLDQVPEGILDALKGPNPRTVGLWHIGTDGVKRWISDSLVSLVQWQLFRETMCFGHRWWIIQGDCGGHRLTWGPFERRLWEQAGHQVVELPAPGALHYAPYDERVKEQVIRADRMRQWRMALAWEDRSRTKHEAATHVAKYREGLEREYNRTMLVWLDEQVKGAVSEVSRKALQALDAAPAGDPKEPEQMERLEAEILGEA